MGQDVFQRSNVCGAHHANYPSIWTISTRAPFLRVYNNDHGAASRCNDCEAPSALYVRDLEVQYEYILSAEKVEVGKIRAIAHIDCSDAYATIASVAANPEDLPMGIASAHIRDNAPNTCLSFLGDVFISPMSQQSATATPTLRFSPFTLTEQFAISFLGRKLSGSLYRSRQKAQ